MPFSFSLNLGILKKERENVLHICLHMLVFSFTKYISIFSFVQYLIPSFMITTTFKTLFPVLDVYQAFSIIIIYVCLYFLFSLEITENKLPRLHHDKGLYALQPLLVFLLSFLSVWELQIKNWLIAKSGTFKAMFIKMHCPCYK